MCLPKSSPRRTINTRSARDPPGLTPRKSAAHLVLPRRLEQPLRYNILGQIARRTKVASRITRQASKSSGNRGVCREVSA